MDTYYEHWNVERIAAVRGNGVVRAPQDSGDYPPVVVRWRRQDYRIDGRGHDGKPPGQSGVARREVLILDIGNVAGDI